MEADSSAGLDLNDAQPGAPQHCGDEHDTADRPRPSLLDVLMPARPPEPKNARVVRLFDGEPERDDAETQATASPAPRAQPCPGALQRKPEPKSREAAKAARNQSLLAAAGFLR